MSGFERLGRELESAASARRPVPWSRRAAGAGGAVAIAAALATVAVVVVGALVLLHGRHAPAHVAAASAQPAPAAQAAAWARALSCPRQRPSTATVLDPAPVMTGAAPDPQLVTALGVLGGAWTSADAAPSGTCVLSSPLYPAGAIDDRYIRYVGPGLQGGNVFVVPATGYALPRDLSNTNKLALEILAHARPLGRAPNAAKRLALARQLLKSRLNRQPLACLITIGGRSPSTGLGLACLQLQVIEHPLGTEFALRAAAFPPITPSAARRVCAHLTAAQGVEVTAKQHAVCLHALLHHPVPTPQPQPQPQVISGLVGNAIATVDVYATTGARRLLTTVTVRNNVYSFLSGGEVTGKLRLVFKDSGGGVIRSTPVHFMTAGAVVSTSSAAPANIPLHSAPANHP
jgi:hypothetical protein